MKIFNFFKESAAELKKVSWPAKDEVVGQTIVVIVSLLIVSSILALVDFGALQIITKIISF